MYVGIRIVTAQVTGGIGPIALSNVTDVLAATKEIADITNQVEIIQETFQSTAYNTWGYSAQVSPVSQFRTSDGKYAAAYAGEKKVQIYIYNTDMTLNRTVTIDRKYEKVGGVTSDRNGFIYIVYGIENQTDDVSKVVLAVTKYDPDGRFLSEVTYAGNETCPYEGDGWGTKNPFRSGNCSIDFNGAILACNYSRTMYNGHQSNHVIYVNTDTMQKVNIAPSYVSHSFDQRILTTSDGSFLTVNHGDATNRAFVLSKIGMDSTSAFKVGRFSTFHFREGANRDYGYNETFAQLGGIAELSQSYVLVATSEKTLSLEPAITSREYCGHSEARNLFIQYIKKDYDNYADQAKYQVAGETRNASGTKPADALTKLYLSEGTVDYGVLWLTDYQDQYFASNAKVLVTKEDELAIFWEKRKYGKNEEGTLVDSYYMILSNQGQVLRRPVSLGKVELTTNEDFIYLDGSVYWTITKEMPKTDESKKMRLITYRVDLNQTVESVSVEQLTYEYKKKIPNDGSENQLKVYDGKTLLQEGIDYKVEQGQNRSTDSEYVCYLKVTGMGRYSGSKTLNYTLVPYEVEIEELYYDSKNSVYVLLDHGYDSDGFQYQYSTSKDMTDAKTKNSKYGNTYLRNLDSKTTYYVRARGYVVVNSKKVYGEYSRIVKVKVK